jgi:hypothetical protein
VNTRVTLATLNQHGLTTWASFDCLEVHVSSSALIVDPVN